MRFVCERDFMRFMDYALKSFKARMYYIGGAWHVIFANDGVTVDDIVLDFGDESESSREKCMTILNMNLYSRIDDSVLQVFSNLAIACLSFGSPFEGAGWSLEPNLCWDVVEHVDDSCPEDAECYIIPKTPEAALEFCDFINELRLHNYPVDMSKYVSFIRVVD